jgi:iron complex outermembrane receptor protein
MHKSHVRGAIVVAESMVLGIATQAFAQNAAPAADSDNVTLQEIVVTARKRAENLQETPVSITALTGEALTEKNFTSLADIAGSAPNLQFFGGTSSQQVFIRGVGQTDYISTTDPGVAVYVDGVYIARQTGTPTSLVDIDRIEVLRGPQGTLFGKNTLGGALNIITKDPDGQLGGLARVTAGIAAPRAVSCVGAQRTT